MTAQADWVKYVMGRRARARGGRRPYDVVPYSRAPGRGESTVRCQRWRASDGSLHRRRRSALVRSRRASVSPVLVSIERG